MFRIYKTNAYSFIIWQPRFQRLNHRNYYPCHALPTTVAWIYTRTVAVAWTARVFGLHGACKWAAALADKYTPNNDLSSSLSGLILHGGNGDDCLRAPWSLPWCPWNAPVEIYNTLLGCPLHTKKKLPWCPCPFKNDWVTIPVCFVFERARAPRQFLLGKGHPLRVL